MEKIIATVYGGRTTTFDVEEIKEMLDTKKDATWTMADNLPKWMRYAGGFKSWEAVWEMIEGLYAIPGTHTLCVRSDNTEDENASINASLRKVVVGWGAKTNQEKLFETVKKAYGEFTLTADQIRDRKKLAAFELVIDEIDPANDEWCDNGLNDYIHYLNKAAGTTIPEIKKGE